MFYYGNRSACKTSRILDWQNCAASLENTSAAFDLSLLFSALPGNYLILLPDAPRFTIAAASDAYLQAVYTRRDAIIGQAVFKAFPDNSGVPPAEPDNTITGVMILMEDVTEQVRAQKKIDESTFGQGAAFHVLLPVA